MKGWHIRSSKVRVFAVNATEPFYGVLKMAEDFDTSWFDLKKYDAVKKFNAYDWYFQLEKRQAIRDYIQVYIEKGIKCGEWMEPLYRNNCKKCIESIKAQPIFVNEKQDLPILSIREAFFSDLDCIQHNHHIDVSNLSFDEFMTNFRSETITPPPLMTSRNCKIMLTIDINASNAQLITDFNKWLDLYRMRVKEGVKSWHESQMDWLDSEANNPDENSSGSLESDKNTTDKRLKNLGSYQKLALKEVRNKFFTVNNINRWHKHRILPYLDLTLIAKATGKKLTQQKIADLLYKDLNNEDIISYIKDNPESLAKDLLGVKTLEALRVQAKSDGFNSEVQS